MAVAEAERACPGCGESLAGAAKVRKWCSEKCRKSQYGGKCKVCGKRTYGGNGRGKAPELCAKHGHPRERIWDRAAITEAMRAWYEQHGVPPVAEDWSPALRSRRGAANAGESRRRFDSGNWPSTTTVIRNFGSWNAGVAAAGISPLPAGYRRQHRAISFDPARTTKGTR